MHHVLGNEYHPNLLIQKPQTYIKHLQAELLKKLEPSHAVDIRKKKELFLRVTTNKLKNLGESVEASHMVFLLPHMAAYWSLSVIIVLV